MSKKYELFFSGLDEDEIMFRIKEEFGKIYFYDIKSKEMVDDFNRYGIIDDDGNQLFPKDGKHFLELLISQFSGSRTGVREIG